MTHTDKALWAEYTRIAEQIEALRLRAHEIASRQNFPGDLKVKAGLLSYHLRAAFAEAKSLAGEQPEDAGKPREASA